MRRCDCTGTGPSVTGSDRMEISSSSWWGVFRRDIDEIPPDLRFIYFFLSDTFFLHFSVLIWLV